MTGQTSLCLCAKNFSQSESSDCICENGEACDSRTSALIKCFALSLCSALVVEKQPIMSNLPQRPLILKTKVQFSVSVR